MSLGCDQPEDGRAENDTGKQLPHHRRLTQPQHDLAEQAADDEQRDHLRDEDRFRGAFPGRRVGCKDMGSPEAGKGRNRSQRSKTGEAGRLPIT